MVFKVVHGRLEAVEATARRSLAELRRVVGLLGEATAAPLQQVPGLPGLAALATSPRVQAGAAAQNQETASPLSPLCSMHHCVHSGSSRSAALGVVG